MSWNLLLLTKRYQFGHEKRKAQRRATCQPIGRPVQRAAKRGFDYRFWSFIVATARRKFKTTDYPYKIKIIWRTKDTKDAVGLVKMLTNIIPEKNQELRRHIST